MLFFLHDLFTGKAASYDYIFLSANVVDRSTMSGHKAFTPPIPL